MTLAGYHLQIDGFPYLLSTKDLPSLLPTTFTPSDDAPTGAGVFPGRLNWPRGTISEEIEPVTGALRAGSMTFTVVDDPADPVLDEYLSIDPRQITTATISASITDTDTSIVLNATVPSSISGLSFPAVVWIDEEAILVDSYAANTLTDCTRGYYGTRASAHRVDSELGQYPEVWPTFPFGVGRRVILWAVDDSDFTAAVAVWRGYLRAPRLAANGAAYELPCEHLSTWEMQRPAGGLTYSVRLRGFSSEAIRFEYHLPDGYSGVNDGEQKVSTFHGWADGNGVTKASIDDFLQWSRDTLSERLRGTTLAGQTKTAQTKVSVRIDRTGSEVYFECGAADTGAGVIAATDVVQPQVGVWQFGKEETANAPNRPGGVYRGGISVQLPTAALFARSDIATKLPIERRDGLPSTFDPPTTYGDGPFTTRIRAVLTAPYDDSVRLLVIPESSASGDVSTGGGPIVTGTARYLPTRAGSDVPSSLQRKVYSSRVSSDGYTVKRDTGVTKAWIDKSLRLNYSQWVTTDHWVYGLKRALEDDNVSTGSDARNWDWTDADEIAKLTASGLSSREWFLDGARSIKDLLGDTLALDGCALSVGPYGRLKIVPVQPAKQHRPDGQFAAEIDCTPFVSLDSRTPIIKGSLPQWTTIADALTNVVSLSTDAVDVTVRDIRSFQRYGQRESLDLKVEGLPLDRREGEDARAIAQRLLQRITGIWSEPVFQVSVTIPANNRSGDPLWYDTTGIYPGSYVILRNGFNLPNGTGARGLDLRGVFVAGRRVNLSNNTIDLTLWLLREVWCYTPCVKAASINAASGIVTAAVRYVKKQHNRSTDYSGGYRSGYADTGAYGKGGVSGFAAGDKVRLVTRDSTSPVQETYTVQSVDSTNGTITMTTAIATAPYNWPTLASSGWVDVIDATFTTTPNNTYFAWVGDGTAAEGVIGASSTQSREFAP